MDGESTDHSSLHANMFPMAFGMVPENNVAKVAEFIKSRGMACSVYGSQYLLDALYIAGQANHALDLMTSEDKRSWMNMIRVGSSMTTEAWDEFFKPNLTWNHAWGSAPANIMARKVMGVEPLEPTFSRFRISPQPGYLKHASIKVPTIRGGIEITLKNAKGQWVLEVSVPGNSSAALLLPAHFTRVKVNGVEAEMEKVIDFNYEQRKRYTLSSGTHHIIAK